LGPAVGITSGLAHGITLAWEFSRASRHGPKPGFWYDVAMSAIRGVGFGAGMAFVYGLRFGVSFAVLSTLGQVAAYRMGIRPTTDYKQGTRPRITRLQLLAALNRTIGYAITGFVSALVARRANAISVGVTAGVAVGVVTAAAMACTPFIEWTADRIPERRMGVVGIWL